MFTSARLHQPFLQAEATLCSASSCHRSVGGSTSSRRLGGLCRLGEFLGKLTGVGGMFQRLLAKLVCGQVIALGVGCGCGFVSVSGKVVQLCGSIVCALWHGALLYGSVNHRESSSENLSGKPPIALAGKAYTRNVSGTIVVNSAQTSPYPQDYK
jgi:hypothetical protein